MNLYVFYDYCCPVVFVFHVIFFIFPVMWRVETHQTNNFLITKFDCRKRKFSFFMVLIDELRFLYKIFRIEISIQKYFYNKFLNDYWYSMKHPDTQSKNVIFKWLLKILSKNSNRFCASIKMASFVIFWVKIW